MVLNMLQEDNNNDNTATTALSSQGSTTPSSPSSFTHEYDTSNCFSRLPNETIFTILAFVITNVSTITTTTVITTTATASIYPPHKQLAVLSQVCRLFNKIANDVLLWQIAFETKFDSEAIIRAGIIDNNVIDGKYSFGGFSGAEGEGEGEGHKITTTQIQNSSPKSFVQIQTGGNIWKELYKERQIVLNKIKNYIKPTLPSPFVYHNNNSENDDASTTVYLDEFMEFHFDDESENDNENDITNNGDSSTLDSTDQVDDNVDYQLFDFDFNFVGNEKNEAKTEEIERNNLDFSFEDNEEFRFQGLDGTQEDNMKFTTGGTVKEQTIEDDAIKEEQNTMELNLEDNLEYTETDSTLDINVDDVVQDLDFVSDDLIKFDDPELDSIFASDTIEIDNFIGVRDSNVAENGENDTLHNEVLVKDTDNSAKEVDHVVQAQGLLNPEINDDLDETYLQDYDESSKLPDFDGETFKLPDYEESSLSKLQNFDQDEPQLQNYEESLTKLQNFDQGESKLQEDSSSKLLDKDYSILNEVINDDLPDYDENEEVHDYNENEELPQLEDFNENGKSINLQDFNDNQVENFSKEIIINEQESDLPAYDENDEITNLLNDDDEVKINVQNENIIIENENNVDLPDYVEDEDESLFNENLVNEREANNEEMVEEDVKENNLPNGNIVVEKDDIENGQPNYDEKEIRQDYENDNVQSFDSLDDDDDDEIEEMNDNDNVFQGFNNPFIFAMNNQALDLDWVIYGNIQSRRIRRKIIRQDDDPELLKILNMIWKICQENDGMNSEVLLGSNVKELTVSLIQSLDKMETQIECLSIALQILSILISWHPELTIDLQKNNSFWTTIHYVMIYIDIFFPESAYNITFKQLALPASAGSAIHIYFHTSFFNLSNPIDNYIPPPQLIPDSNIFNNVYNKLELKPGEGMIQPFEEDFSGKWCGYYAYFLPRPIRESSMDITSLEFSPSEPGKVYYLNLIDNNPVRVTDKVVKEFSGGGIDQIGEFVIKHGIITEKGNVNFIKTYIDRHSWIYDGVLLPVGVCGRWGTISEWHGNFWVWKK